MDDRYSGVPSVRMNTDRLPQLLAEMLVLAALLLANAVAWVAIVHALGRW
jgi:hypothetical protein